MAALDDVEPFNTVSTTDHVLENSHSVGIGREMGEGSSRHDRGGEVWGGKSIEQAIKIFQAQNASNWN